MNKFDEAISALKGELIKEKNVLVVYLYGSVARGDFSERHSDMDLFIVLNGKNVTERIKERMNSRIMPIGLRYGVRMHPEYQGTDIKKQDQSLIEKIIEEGKIIYSAGIFNLSYKQIGLKQYIIYSYSLKNMKNRSLFSKALHGRKSWYYKGNEKVVKEYRGIADKESIILLGKGNLMIAKARQKDIEGLFNRFGVDYTIERIVYG
ncbi:MAG: nucleotidyltransferase domain-containing protein [Candidatus Woesearchaeota archaeon]|nr:nucleotidyltransferase domain-containing protein [Candidatus Woesearchaeota archaeon]